jgi:hypothetical protein
MTTTSRHTFKVTTTLLLAISVMTLAAVAQSSDKRKNPTSKLYVADIEGSASINTGEKIEELTKKSVHVAEGVVLETEPESQNAIVLSNGTGISFDPDTRLEMRRFLQEPFSPNRNDLEIEPSVSQTAAFLPRGAVGLCTSKLVAGSTMTYATRHATVAIRGRKVVIETTDSETIVSLVEGDVTVRGDLMTGGQTLKPGQQAVISRNSNSEPPSIVIRDIPSGDVRRIEDKVALACMARKTVYFEVAERRNQDSVFAPNDVLIEEIVPVEVLPGTIPSTPTNSPYQIAR